MIFSRVGFWVHIIHIRLARLFIFNNESNSAIIEIIEIIYYNIKKMQRVYVYRKLNNYKYKLKGK